LRSFRVKLSVVRDLELFRAQERINEIGQEGRNDSSEKEKLRHQRTSFPVSRSHPSMYAIAMRKKATVAHRHPVSHMLSCSYSGVLVRANPYGKRLGIKSG
jgi:hypothetical protein